MITEVVEEEMLAVATEAKILALAHEPRWPLESSVMDDLLSDVMLEAVTDTLGQRVGGDGTSGDGLREEGLLFGAIYDGRLSNAMPTEEATEEAEKEEEGGEEVTEETAQEATDSLGRGAGSDGPEEGSLKGAIYDDLLSDTMLEMATEVHGNAMDHLTKKQRGTKKWRRHHFDPVFLRWLAPTPSPR